MFKSKNFCHIASNNRNQVKVGVFTYRTTDSLATVLANGYFNERIIDINLHDLIIHEKIDALDNTKVVRNLLCVTERTLENVGTSVVKSDWEGDIEQAIEDLRTYVNNNFVKIDGTSVMTGPLLMRATDDFKCAVAPYWDGIGFFKLNDNNSVTLMASLEYEDGLTPATDNKYNFGTSTKRWKDARIARVITGVVNNGYDIAVPVTASSDTLALKSEVDLAANSGRMITAQGVWYAKMYAATVAPSAEDGTNYADFSQTDGQGNPIIVIYERQSGAWVQSETITPPAEYDGYVPITSKIWDIAEQTGQQGGRVLWNHQSKDFTPYPQIISFENAALTGVPTAPLPTNASPNNQIATKEYVDNATPSGGYHPDLFSWQWADHILNDVQWLRADTFSWQSGAVYEAAYNHLADEAIGETLQTVTTLQGTYVRYVSGDEEGEGHPYCWRRDDSVLGYTNSETPAVNDYLYTFPTTQSQTIYTITAVGSTISNEHTETIAGITITYYLAPDGHKIVLTDQETNVESIYTATGVAWYYILDTVNQRFKLPRSKHNKYAATLGVKGNGITLGLTNGTLNGGLQTWNTLHLAAYTENYGTPVNTQKNSGGSALNDSQYKSIGITTDSTKSGIIAQQEQDTDQYKYLYFYVGNFTQTALENTAGLNAELFNDKADVNLANVLSNVDFVVERQEPTAENNYTWYRKYRSGWVEQGGSDFTTRTINAGAGAVWYVTMPVPMSDTNYNIQLSFDNGNLVPAVNNNNQTTTTQVYLGCKNLYSANATSQVQYWQVSGKAAN